MSGYILSIAGIILLSAVVTMIAPSGRMGKFIRGITKLACLAVLIAPFTSFAEGKGFEFAPAAFQTDGDYMQTCAALAERGEAEKITAYLQEKFSVKAEVCVSCEGDSPFSVKKVAVEVKDFGINPPEAHIDIIGEIKRTLEKSYRCETEVV